MAVRQDLRLQGLRGSLFYGGGPDMRMSRRALAAAGALFTLLGSGTVGGSAAAQAARGTSSWTAAKVSFLANADRTYADVSRIGPATASGIDGVGGITAGPDGALWFTNRYDSTIGRITTTGQVTTYTGTGIDDPEGITAGPDGALWFTNDGNGSIGRITTAGTVTNYTDPSIYAPSSITAGPDGALWFINRGNDSIGRITTSGTVTNYTSPGIDDPEQITAGPDGALWFTNFYNSIGRITTSGTVTTYTDPSMNEPQGITAGPDGALWFTNYGDASGNSIGRITTGGTVTSYTDPSIDAPSKITTGPDGALWFTNDYGGPDGFGSIGRITTSGTVTNYADPSFDQPYGITVGSDGALWFSMTDTIGRITTSGAVTIYADLSSTTTLGSAPDPSNYGQSVTFTATVSPTDGMGTVAFSADGNPISGCSGQSLSPVSGSTYRATCTTSSLTAGSHTISAAYSGDPTYAESAASLTQEVGSTTTTVASSLNPSATGQQVTFTATVSPTDGGGTVAFSADGNPITGCPAEQLTLADGSYEATCTSSSLAGGNYVVSAAYSGDTGYGGSSGSVTQTVRTATATTVSSSGNPALYGDPLTFTATVSPTDGGGTVSFSADGNPISACSGQTLSLIGGSYQATCTTYSLTVGSHDITAAYSGDTNYAGSSGNDTISVTQATPADVVTNSGPITLGAPVTFTATVSGAPAAATPAGAITWLISGSAGATTCTSSTTTLDSGTASCTINATQSGTYVVSNEYGGDANYTAVNSNADTVTVTPLDTTTTVTSSLNPSAYGQPVTFTATVSPSDGAGTISFSSDGKQVLGCSSQTLTLVSGKYQATCTTSALAGGDHAVQAAYSGGTNYSGSSATITQTVHQKATATTLNSGTDPSTYGHAVTFTATVSPTDGEGTVSFSRGTGKGKTAICPNQNLSLVDGSYQARCTISSLAAATYTITAAYSGDTDYGASVGTVSQTVNKTPTRTTLSSSANPSTHGQRIMLTAAISPTDNTGTVTFWYEGNTIPGCTSEPLKEAGGTHHATCITSSLPVGKDKIKAVYSGDKNCFGSTGTVSQVVNRTSTNTALKSSPNPSVSGKTVTLTATTSPTDGGGRVEFSSNDHVISGCSRKTLTLVGTSYEAVCKTSVLVSGTDTIKATYSGDAAYSASSHTVKQQVRPA